MFRELLSEKMYCTEALWHWWNFIFAFLYCVCVSQLARIQTDSVASRLKELYPDVHLEIGKRGNFAQQNFTCIAAFVLCLSIKCIFFWTCCLHTHTHNFSFSCPHALTACLRTERDCVLLRMCNLYHRSTAESHCLCQKTWMMMSELEPVCTTQFIS